MVDRLKIIIEAKRITSEQIYYFNNYFFTVNGLQCFAADTNQLQAKKSDECYTQIAIDRAKSNPKAPFASLIVDNKTGEILSKGLNAQPHQHLFISNAL